MKLFFGFLVTFILFSSTANANAVKVEAFRGCEDLAWDVADYVYDKTGDGFTAAEAYYKVMASCNEE